MALNANQLGCINTFSGEKDEDIEFFIMQVERIAAGFGWTDGQTAQMVETKLTGKAAKWYRALVKTKEASAHLEIWNLHVAAPGNDPTPNTGLKSHLLGRFLQRVDTRAAVEAILHLKQGPSETVTEFHDRVVLAVDRKNYNKTLAEKQQDVYKREIRTDILTFFTAGLNEEIRKKVMGVAVLPQDVEGLLAAAQHVENEQTKTTKPAWLNELQTDADGTHGEVAATVAAAGAAVSSSEVVPHWAAELREEIAAIKRQSRPTQAKKSNDSGRAGERPSCWSCGQSGHMSFSCPKAASGGARPRQQRMSAGGRSVRLRASQAKAGGGGRSRRVFVLEDEEDEEFIEELLANEEPVEFEFCPN
jgi:hypothetical protein